jgi:PPM family protein phosphatase
MKMKMFGLTDIGKVREENQDIFHIDDSLSLMMVADGMGGMDDGAAAAQFTVQGMLALIRSYLAKPEVDIEGVEYRRYLNRSANEVNAHLRETVGKRTGSTFVLFQMTKDTGLFVNVGDSPGYLYRDGKLRQMTRDHNIAGAMAEMKLITPAEAKTHPAHNRLTAYLGMNGAIQISIKKIKVQPGDRIVLCSDGLTGMVEETVIEEILKSQADPEITIKALVDMAVKAGGVDNVTVVIAEVFDESAQFPATAPGAV